MTDIIFIHFHICKFLDMDDVINYTTMCKNMDITIIEYLIKKRTYKYIEKLYFEMIRKDCSELNVDINDISNRMSYTFILFKNKNQKYIDIVNSILDNIVNSNIIDCFNKKKILNKIETPNKAYIVNIIKNQYNEHIHRNIFTHMSKHNSFLASILMTLYH